MRGISLNTVLELNFSFSDIACIVIGSSALKAANISMISFCLFVNPDFLGKRLLVLGNGSVPAEIRIQLAKLRTRRRRCG